MKKRIPIMFLPLLIVLLLISNCFADNPVVRNIFTADPAAMVYNGTCYLYTGHDEGSTGYVMKDWKCYSSTDMINWTDRGTPLAVSAFSWAKADAWASQVIYRNGKFYWYVCCEHKTIPGKAIGVAVSTSPTGPFTDALGRALITNDMTKFTSISYDDIDPTVFIDSNGQAYLYWGNTACMYVKLNSDMISISGSIGNVTSQLQSYTEAPWLYKRGSTYYLVYAHGWYESIAYATSSSPTGPWTYRGIISNRIGTSCNTEHAAIIDFNGSSYFISHNDALPGGGHYKRSVYIEKFNYNSDGTIPLIPMTSTGVNGVRNRIQSYNYQNMYWRHENYDAILSSNNNPAIDSQFQIVPGLANSGSGYVSFQAVSWPGYYLRHYNYDFVLAKNDGSSIFKADATFKKVAGLKDSSWTSFQSYNFTDRYIRHYNNALRIDPISTDLDKQDATFKITN
jgi:hypothetical protein